MIVGLRENVIWRGVLCLACTIALLAGLAAANASAGSGTAKVMRDHLIKYRLPSGFGFQPPGASDPTRVRFSERWYHEIICRNRPYCVRPGKLSGRGTVSCSWHPQDAPPQVKYPWKCSDRLKLGSGSLRAAWWHGWIQVICSGTGRFRASVGGRFLLNRVSRDNDYLFVRGGSAPHSFGDECE